MWNQWFANKRLEERQYQNCTWEMWRIRLKELHPSSTFRYIKKPDGETSLHQWWFNKISLQGEWIEVPITRDYRPEETYDDFYKRGGY